MSAYLGAWLLFKPVAATFTAAGFLLVGNGASLTASLSGLALIVMSLAALLPFPPNAGHHGTIRPAGFAGSTSTAHCSGPTP